MGSYKQGYKVGNWLTILITHIRGQIPPLRTTHEPPKFFTMANTGDEPSFTRLLDVGFGGKAISAVRA